MHKKAENKKLKYFPAGYVGRFYCGLPNNVDSAVNSDFYERVANDTDIPLEDVQKYLLATSDFAKGMQDGINLYVMRDKINNASFRQKLDPISKNIFRRQNPLKLVFQDISTFDAQNPVVGSLLRELDIGKKDLASNLVKKAPKPGLTNDIQKGLDALRGDNFFNNNNKNNFLPPPSPPAINNFILPPKPPPPRTFNNLNLPPSPPLPTFKQPSLPTFNNVF